jgi:hypothetical protein
MQTGRLLKIINLNHAFIPAKEEGRQIQGKSINQTLLGRRPIIIGTRNTTVDGTSLK